ncbi:major Facilitator Superfamily protein [Mycobacterium kansasii 732]|nr:major Facilitator Superfamily protein [Mycobacterium kansasii 732]
MQTTSTRRWSLLAIALIATLCATIFINGIAFLIPALNDVRGISLSEAALLSAMPSFGMVFTLIGWGYVLDLVGERIVLTVGLALTAAAAYGASLVPQSMLAEGVALFAGVWPRPAPTPPAGGW